MEGWKGGRVTIPSFLYWRIRFTLASMIERKNINRGYQKLIVWQDAADLYVLTWKIFRKFITFPLFHYSIIPFFLLCPF